MELSLEVKLLCEQVLTCFFAFVIKPNKDDKDKEHLKTFIRKVIANFIDRASQREHTAIKVYDIHKNEKDDTNVLNESMPEYLDYAKKEKLIPNETYVLIGFYKSTEHLNWILQNHWYNFRTGLGVGSKILNEKDINAKYLVLHGHDELETAKIYSLSSGGVKIFSEENLIKLKYPTEPKGKAYIMFKIENEVSDLFSNRKWDLRNLQNFETRRKSAKPYTVTLTELMKVKVK